MARCCSCRAPPSPAGCRSTTAGEIALLAVVGAFSAGLPYLIELLVMRRVTMRTFSVLQALYPAAGVAVGVIGLGQRLRPIELGGILLVTIASALALESSAGGDTATASEALTESA